MKKWQKALGWLLFAILISLAGWALFNFVFQNRYPTLISWEDSPQFDLISPTFVSGRVAQIIIDLGDSETDFIFKCGQLRTTVKLSGDPEVYTVDVSIQLNESLSMGNQNGK